MKIPIFINISNCIERHFYCQIIFDYLEPIQRINRPYEMYRTRVTSLLLAQFTSDFVILLVLFEV